MSPPPRLPNWPVRLLQWAEARRGQPFTWGVTDCHALALASYAVLYGRLPVEAPRWASLREARRLLDAGWDPPTALPRLGATAIGPGFCRVGDLVVEPAVDGVHPVLVALGDGLFLTSAPDLDVVGYVSRSALSPAATYWRWAGG